MTVLIADVVGSTALIGDLDPEDAQGLLDGAITVMMAAVQRNGGTVTQTRGDSIVALFGAPVADENHAVRACYAALAMQEAIRRDREEARRGPARTVQIRAGLNSGEVVVRSTANDLGLEYSATGRAFQLATQMEQAARPGAVVLSPATRALVEGHVRVRSLGPVAVKGLPQPVEIYELVAADPPDRNPR